MAKVYGTTRSWKNASGHGRACRLSLTYSTSQTSDTFTLTYKIGYDIEWAGAIDLTIAGTRKDNISYSSTFEFGAIKSSKSGSIKGHEGATYTLTYSRGTSPKAVTFTVKSTNYTNNQDLSVKINFTVPALEKYPITYSTGGISGISNMPGTGYKYYSMTYYMSQTKPTRTNYTFKAWSGKRASAPLSPILTLMSGAAYNYNDGLTATATWTENTYTISYNNNGGSGTINSTTYGAATTPSVSLNNGAAFTKTGYNLDRWNTKADGSGVTYQKGEVYTKKTNLTLYAQWTKASYSLNFDEVRPHTPFDGQAQTIEFETPILNLLGTNVPIDNSIEGNNYYYSYSIFDGWYNITDNFQKIDSLTTMPAHNIYVAPKTIVSGREPNISKVTAIRAQYDSDSDTIISDDTGEGCILTIEGSPITIYRFDKNDETDTGELYTPEQIRVNIIIENQTYSKTVNNSFPITFNIYSSLLGGDTHPDIDKQMLLESAYNIAVTITGLAKEGALTYEIGSSPVKNDLLTKAQFTIDISANGDRIGIFQPINDYDENNPTVYPKHIVELNGGFKIQSDENPKGEFIIAENLRPIDSNSTPEDGVYFSTTRTANPNSTVYFGIGKGGVNRGIYLRNKNGNIGATSDGGGWMIYASGMTNNRTNVNIPGNLLVSGFAGIIQMTAIPAGGPGSPTLVPADNTTIYEPIPGWLICNGASVSKNVYPELFNAIQYTYGGSGNNFNLPDLRGRFPLGSNSSYPLNDKKGSADAVVVSHTHPTASNGYSYMLAHGSLLGGDMESQSGTGRHYPYQGKRDDNAYWGSQANTGAASSGVSGTGKNMPPYIGVNFIICTGHIA